MPDHDQFRQLGALAAIGQVTASEERELTVHLRECFECREAYADYSRILRQDLPQADLERFRHKLSLHPATDAELRERFLARAEAHGVAFSPEVQKRTEPTPRFNWLRIPHPLIVSATAMVAIVVGFILSSLIRENTRFREPRLNPPAIDTQSKGLQQQVDQTSSRVEALSGQVLTLKEKNNNLVRTLDERERTLANAKRELDELRIELSQVRIENSSLTGVGENDRSEISELRKQVQTLQASNASSIATMVALQDKISSLNASLEQQSEKLAMEHQLASISTDVRQLMGARELHIIDVHDVNGTGKAAKSFGRVFYSEGQSLVFYAFDLSNGKLTPAKYSFQAWGQQEGQAQSVRNLGFFSIDDREQRRWVLKVTDPSLLKGMDAVFVTAETAQNGSQPRGRRLLYAYLAGKANHP